ncbi:DEAD/DEAH box helicase [Bacillota bacterium Meth-B3]
MDRSLASFAPAVGRWFEACVGEPTAVQAEGWPVIAAGGHALISAPTGTGKTLAAFLVFLDKLHGLKQAGALEDRLYVIYISPLKALGNDIQKNLRRPLEGIPCPEVRVGIRTGDTEASERRAMRRHPPHILITTPESLFLLLSSKTGRDMIRTTEAVILDELHAIIDTKRGAHLMLSLSRLDALCGRSVQRIALSATIRPLERAARFLSVSPDVTIVAPAIRKDADILVTSALPDMRALPEASIWPELARSVYDLVKPVRSAIAFVEGRAQAEKLAHGVNAIAGEGFARSHHGCVSKEQRLEAENQLKSGELKLMCATSSMELGIDVGEIDLVVQIGCPLTVSGALQRLGRAGHNPGRTSVMRVFPRMASEIAFCGMTARCALDGDIEPMRPPENCLDIVAQHVVSMATAGTYTVDELLDVIRGASSFRGIAREDLEGVLRMLAGDFEHERDRPARARVLYDRVHGRVSGDNYSRMLAVCSGGTIPDRGWFPVVLEDGTRLGELDEEYVFEARVGDKFLLGAFAWRMLAIQKDRVVVAAASAEGAQTPFWKGDGRGRSYEVGLKFGEHLRRLNEAHLTGSMARALARLRLDEAAAANATRHLARQIEHAGCLPDDRTIILEHFTDEAGEHQLMVHSIFGGRVNTALEMLLRHAAGRATGQDVQSFADDDGILLYLMGTRDIPDGLLFEIDPDTAEEVVRALLPQTPIFTMLFRYNAARALMMGVRKGGRVPLWVQRMRGAELLSDAAAQDGHPLVRETMRECMGDFLNLAGVREVLSRVRSGAIAVHEYHAREPSPMALPLRRQVEATLMYEYSPIPSAAKRASEALLERADAITPAKVQLDLQAERRHQPENAERLHALLMAEGDIVAGELDAPVEWLTELIDRDRALYVEPGLWICAEQAALYEAALHEDDIGARQRVARRCLRYRGAQDAASLAQRYGWPEAVSAELLSALEAEGAAIAHEGQYHHAELYRRAQRSTVAMRRREAETLPPERYAALLVGSLRAAGGPADQLGRAMTHLTGLTYPADLWENVILPARVTGFRPKLLDELLMSGAYFWKIEDAERLLISFHRQDEVDWDAGAPTPEGLTGDALKVYEALSRRGASFAHALASLLGGASALDALGALALKGLVRADSFAPIRAWAARTLSASSAKKRSRARVAAQDAGRWELVRPLMEPGMEEKLQTAFDRYGIVCRETLRGMSFESALTVLRVWEYTGRARRGYFVRELSGAQFIRAEDYERTQALLKHPDASVVWVNAADPMQPYGKILPHGEGASFLCVPGTAVALSAGRAVAVLERQGEVLRLFDESAAAPALEALARDFELMRIFSSGERITVKQYPDAAREALEKAGFFREMRDYVLWRKIR